MVRTPTNAAASPAVHRQPADSDRKPPATGPMAGPRNGASANKPILGPRSFAVYMSEMVPPAFVNALAPKVPAKNRKANIALKEGAPATPHEKAVKGMKVYTKVPLRPRTSDNGAQTSGPRKKPKTKIEVTVGQMISDRIDSPMMYISFESPG